MRKFNTALFFLFFSVLTSLSGQKYNWKRAVLPAALSGISGASWGLHEATAYHWSAFQKRFPKANPNYWNPDISWKNKWKNGDVEQGEAFMGSSTVFVSFTDAKHMLASVHRLSTFGAGLTITIGEKKPLKHYLADV